MVDPVQLTNDIAANTLSLVVPALLWAVLFLVAWEREPFADSIGFGRRAFWLLLPGALLASFAFLPIAPVSTDWLAVSFGGALFPLLVGLLALGRYAPPRSRSVRDYLVILAVESAFLFVLVLPATSGLSRAFGASMGTSEFVGNDLLVVLATAVFAAVVGALTLGSSETRVRRIGFLVVLTSAVLGLTFLASNAVPGVGITETFPFYLAPPFFAGLIAAVAASRIFPGEEAFAIPTAFLASTFGVLLGADLLREPPLYGTGPSGLYTIGGAGVLDLVYLSGFLGFGAALLGHRLLGRGATPAGPPLPARAIAPVSQLERAFRDGLEGRLNDSVRGAYAASRDAAVEAQRLTGLDPNAAGNRPWAGLPVPGWIVSDQANLQAAANAGTTDGREGFRAWLTARWLVLVARDIGMRRFATLWSRVAAFAIDLALVTAPAVVLWLALLLAIPGGLDASLTNVGFNAAIFGFIAWAFLYFVLTETFGGTTVGKRLLSLEVRERSLESPSGLSALVRNTTVLPLLTVVGIGVALALAFGLKTGPTTSLSLAGIPLPSGLLALVGVVSVVLGGVALLGSCGAVLIVATLERQRLGDLWAGTWVLKRAPPKPTVAPVPPAVSAPAPKPPAGPSG